MDGVLTVLRPTDTPKESACSICGQDYGKAGSGTATNLIFLSHLPGAFRKLFIEESIEAVVTPCGHAFCTFCISVWLSNPGTCTCPMCRAPFHLPAEQIVENTDGGLPDAGNEGLVVPLHIPTPEADEIFDIMKLSTRQLLTTKTPMPFVWDTEAMLSDLPKIMVTIARRFHYQSLQGPVPADLTVMRLYNPTDRFIGEPLEKLDLNSFSRADAPLAQHPDAHKLYSLLCKHVEALERTMGDAYGRCQNWEGPAKMLTYKVINEGMPSADGGIGQEKWWAYIQCVIKALLVWQAYCEHDQMLWAERKRLEDEWLADASIGLIR